MADCVGFVLEPYLDNNPQYGKCTYFSRIDNIEAASSANTLALTTVVEFDGLSMLAFVQPHDVVPS